jgi:hypothetical protein
MSIISQKTSRQFSIFLSISFHCVELQKIFEIIILNNENIKAFPGFVFFFQDEKTSQMRHISYLCNKCRELSEYPSQPEWIMFCDDDDIYEETRVEEFADRIDQCIDDLQVNNADMKFAGVYEKMNNQNHYQQRHEYWAYCVRFDILNNFILSMIEITDVIDHACCDVLFAEYLRRLSSKLFSEIDKSMYKYRRDENMDSVTGVITTIKTTSVWKAAPPPKESEKIVDYIILWNDYLENNLEIYMHDTFLKTIVGFDMEKILKTEFCQDYPYIDYIDQKHIDKIREYHIRIQSICNNIYDSKLPIPT